MKATKEQCEIALLVLDRNKQELTQADYDNLRGFLLACKSRLPSAAAVARDARRKKENAA